MTCTDLYKSMHFCSSKKAQQSALPGLEIHSHLSAVRVVLLLFLSACRNDPRAKLVSEPGNIWAGFWRAGEGKAGRLPATGHWHFSVCSLAENCVCDWHSNGAHCLFTWVLTCVCVWVCAVEGPPSQWTVCNSKCSREGRTRTHRQTHKHTWRHTSL